MATAQQSSLTVEAGDWSAELLQLAAHQRMNTDVRRAVFCIIMGSEDYMDASEKLLRLPLKVVHRVTEAAGCCFAKFLILETRRILLLCSVISQHHRSSVQTFLRFHKGCQSQYSPQSETANSQSMDAPLCNTTTFSESSYYPGSRQSLKTETNNASLNYYHSDFTPLFLSRERHSVRLCGWPWTAVFKKPAGTRTMLLCSEMCSQPLKTTVSPPNFAFGTTSKTYSAKITGE